MTRLTAALAVLCLALVACDTPRPSGRVHPSTSGTAAAPSGSSTTVGPSPSTSPAVVTWTRVLPTGLVPVPRSGHTWTVDPSGAVAYLYAGRAAGSILGDLWVYDLAADAWEPVLFTGAPPPSRTGHAAAWIDGVGLVVIGGRDGDGQPLDDAWRFDADAGAWQPVAVTGDRPAARSDSCATVDPDGRLWITHGLAGGGTALDDTWTYAPTSGSWALATPTGAAPLARAGHACWWSDDGRLVLLGGQAGAGPLADLWTLMTPGSARASWSVLESATAISARSEVAVARHGNRIVAFGGLGPNGAATADVGTFGAANQFMHALAAAGDAPIGRSRATLVDDPAAERMLLFGGVTATGPTDESWQATLR